MTKTTSHPLPLEFTTRTKTASTFKVDHKATMLPLPNCMQPQQPQHTTANTKFVPFCWSMACHHLNTPGTTHQHNPLMMMPAMQTTFCGWWWRHKPCPTPLPKTHFSADDTANNTDNCLMMTTMTTQLCQQLWPKPTSPLMAMPSMILMTTATTLPQPHPTPNFEMHSVHYNHCSITLPRQLRLPKYAKQQWLHSIQAARQRLSSACTAKVKWLSPPMSPVVQAIGSQQVSSPGILIPAQAPSGNFPQWKSNMATQTKPK